MNEIANIRVRRASIKETGEELSQEDWERFDAAVAQVKVERDRAERNGRDGSFRLADLAAVRAAGQR